jgi:hypothetical protein
MERRMFLAALVGVPLVGRRLAAAHQAEADTVAESGSDTQADVAAAVWATLDHASSWHEASRELRSYAAEGGAGADAFGQIAELIERVSDEPAGVLGLYPATVLTLASLRAVRLYGTAEEHRRQVEIVQRLAEAA